MSENTFLLHYGVRGMRWGKRKPGTGTPSTRSKGSGDYDTSRTLLKKPLKELTNDEISTLTKRLQLERSYADLTANQSGYKKGKKLVDEVLSVAGTLNKVAALSNSPVGQELKRQMK